MFFKGVYIGAVRPEIASTNSSQTHKPQHFYRSFQPNYYLRAPYKYALLTMPSSNILLLVVFLFSCGTIPEEELVIQVKDDRMLATVVNLEEHRLQFHWKDLQGERFGSLGNLRDGLEVEGEELVFATNGGMFNQAHAPQGLYVEAGQELARLDTISNGFGNFYLQPNGIFYLTKSNQPGIVSTKDYSPVEPPAFATQSGPMLVINGQLHSAFNEGSPNLNIRNGVGLLPDGNLLFVISKEKVNFFDFATFFQRNGCQQALYLDGFVSKTYYPAGGRKDLSGDFGVIISATKTK